MAGHVFVVQADLRELVCDHWLLPVGPEYFASRSWRSTDAWRVLVANHAMVADRPRVVTLPWSGPARPWPAVVVGGGRSGSFQAESARQFLIAATAAGATTDRAKPLLALPVLGTGYGGKRSSAGAVLRALMPVLAAHVAKHDVDVALVTWEPEDFAAAQSARGEHVGWPDLTAAQQQTAVTLAGEAARGRLVLFMGAGISAGAGLPTWDGLLDGLAADAGFNADERAGLRRLNHLDRAQVIGRRLGGTRAVGDAVRERLAGHHGIALAHALAAGLPVREFITTNYDDCFERACDATRDPVARLPYAPASGAERWLLKMHGCVTAPDDIVLTREDYLRYAQRSAALAGIVQAMLITKHMLFVGFSLDDENFHRIVDAVRRALDGAERDALGTVVSLFANPLIEQLWGDDLRWVHMGASDGAHAGAARRFEVFLDCLSFHARSPRHLLSRRFAGVLDDREAALKQRLITLRDWLRAEPPPAEGEAVAGAWALVEDLLWKLGDRS